MIDLGLNERQGKRQRMQGKLGRMRRRKEAKCGRNQGRGGTR